MNDKRSHSTQGAPTPTSRHCSNYTHLGMVPLYDTFCEPQKTGLGRNRWHTQKHLGGLSNLSPKMFAVASVPALFLTVPSHQYKSIKTHTHTASKSWNRLSRKACWLCCALIFRSFKRHNMLSPKGNHCLMPLKHNYCWIAIV